ncbi:hypothetical protein BU14_1188s0004 [Porphyra umbilicalis]|uniref:Uncharacterized protein n=1 Tax=Porphyra umbilicalis TaxID=2786 RepID=A0A1X6NM97_PORUM|nr:hypothetical protein BU14_1188s0004 [Porphyra umbilicalis]|eukprot:OSX69761.1 hypothetical protein BU14_1188s0004 [Porphyra umbilicalis]
MARRSPPSTRRGASSCGALPTRACRLQRSCTRTGRGAALPPSSWTNNTRWRRWGTPAALRRAAAPAPSATRSACTTCARTHGGPCGRRACTGRRGRRGRSRCSPTASASSRAASTGASASSTCARGRPSRRCRRTGMRSLRSPPKRRAAAPSSRRAATGVWRCGTRARCCASTRCAARTRRRGTIGRGRAWGGWLGATALRAWR